MEHHYEVELVWTGNRGQGTADYRAYGRDHEIRVGDAAPLLGSSDVAFRGDHARWNPEQLLVAALSQCHMLSYLHLCADAGVVVVAYEDRPQGVMEQRPDGGGRFRLVTLRPSVTVSDEAMLKPARELQTRAHERCFIANSVNFPVIHEPTLTVLTSPALPDR